MPSFQPLGRSFPPLVLSAVKAEIWSKLFIDSFIDVDLFLDVVLYSFSGVVLHDVAVVASSLRSGWVSFLLLRFPFGFLCYFQLSRCSSSSSLGSCRCGSRRPADPPPPPPVAFLLLQLRSGWVHHFPLFFYGVSADFHGFANRCHFNSMDSPVAIAFTRLFSWIHLSLLFFTETCAAFLLRCLASFFRGVIPFCFSLLLPFSIMPSLAVGISVFDLFLLPCSVSSIFSFFRVLCTVFRCFRCLKIPILCTFSFFDILSTGVLMRFFSGRFLWGSPYIFLLPFGFLCLWFC
jgi:hypothetical protein